MNNLSVLDYITKKNYYCGVFELIGKISEKNSNLKEKFEEIEN